MKMKMEKTRDEQVTRAQDENAWEKMAYFLFRKHQTKQKQAKTKPE